MMLGLLDAEYAAALYGYWPTMVVLLCVFKAVVDFIPIIIGWLLSGAADSIDPIIELSDECFFTARLDCCGMPP